MSVVEIRMLRWMCSKTRKDEIRSTNIVDLVGIVPIEDKLRENKLMLFGHICRRLVDAFDKEK